MLCVLKNIQWIYYWITNIAFRFKIIMLLLLRVLTAVILKCKGCSKFNTIFIYIHYTYTQNNMSENMLRVGGLNSVFN